MRYFGFQARLGAVLLLLYATFWTWQTPGWLRGPLTQQEVDYHFEQMDKNLAMPTDEKHEIITRLRAWALEDDGKPVFMLNLMRYFPELREFQGAPEFEGTPVESNAYYETQVAPMAFASGSYPLFSSMTQGANIIEQAAELDNWDRVIVMRYPSRRAVLELFADPAYAPYEPYKMMALKVVLVPTQGDAVIPELRWLVGGLLLLLFTAVGWRRASAKR